MAGNAKLMKEISDQFLLCKICLETFRDPKTLVCLHTFCSECLQKQVDSDATRSARYNVYSRYITCPLCRKKTEIPSGGVRRLPDNFLVSNLTEVVNKRSRCKVPPCEICHTVRPRKNEACSKCLDCSKLLCKTCVEMHLTTKVTQKHSLIDIEGEKDIECKEHPEELVRFYCEPCEKCICVVCTFQDHRDHDVCCFSEGFEKYKAALNLLLQQCKHRMGETGGRLKVIDKYESVLKDIRERIRDMAISYISKVRATERELLKKIDDMVGDNVLQFIENKTWLQENFENLQTTCNLTEIIMKDKGVEMLLLKKEIQQKMAGLLEHNLPNVPNDMMTQVHFVPGDVKLGHISVSNGSEVNGIAGDCHESRCQQTQTDSLQTRNMSDCGTTMSCDVTRKLVDGEVQTEPKVTANRDTNTPIVETRDKGVVVYCYDSKTKGTMTSKLDMRSLKIQTDKTITYDQNIQTTMVDCSADVGTRVHTERNVHINGTSALNAYNMPATKSEKAVSSPRTIRSRKIQTHISALDNESDEEFATSLSSRSNVRKTSARVAPPRRPEMVDAETNTYLAVRVVPEMFEKETSPEHIILKNTSTMAVPDGKTITTQTLRVRRRETAVGTDYEGQFTKSTSTEKINCVDTETAMPQIHFENKLTLTEKLSTADRAISTMCVNTSDRATSTSRVNQGDKTTQACPDVRLKSTNTMKTMIRDKECQTKANTRDSQTNPIKELLEANLSTSPPPPAPAPATHTIATGTDVSESRRPSLVSASRSTVDMNVETETVEHETKTTETCSILMSHASTETLDVMTTDKQTGTPHVHLVDQWTFTIQPQMINTGVSPPRPATTEVGICTNPVATMESATYTEVVTFRETSTETVIVVADNETLTDRMVVCDAQTGMDRDTEDCETSTEDAVLQDTGSMTNDIIFYDKPETECKETQVSPDREMTSSVNSVSSSVREVQTDIARIDCAICDHQCVMFEDRTMTDSGSTPHVQTTHDVGTMALSVLSSPCAVVDGQTQTVPVRLCDKSIATSTEFDDLENTRGREYVDAATSTESLPYIGLLSELDVDDLIVVPEMQFDFMLDDYYSAEEYVEMVDTETWTESLESTEAETQTLVITASPEASPGLGMREYEQNNDVHFVNVGVNTISKMTFEKETSTPIRHLFSKGTMTFYISKTDKSTSTFSQSRQIGDSKFGGCIQSKTIIPKVRVEDKDTMTYHTERRDVATETDPTVLDGRITQCITKLRNVSEKLNSPTLRQSSDGDAFFGKSFLTRTRGTDSSGTTTSSSMFDSNRSRDGKKSSPGSPSEEERQKQLQLLLAETQAILKSKEPCIPSARQIRNERSPVRKPQPITTLKGRSKEYRTQSLPRQFSIDYPSNVRLGCQPTPPSRLPLLRYNSAPGRIATVPTQKLQDMKKAHQQRGPSPSKIPVKASCDSPPPPASPQHDVYSQAQKSIKPQQRPSLPAICETRTPSSCSDISTSSYMSAASGDSFTVSNTASNFSTDHSDGMASKESTTGESADEATKAVAHPATATGKKEKGMGFMQRLLSKKKKEPEQNGPSVATSSSNRGAAAADKYRYRQSKPDPPKEPPLPKKSRGFVYVRQRIMSIQHDKEDELNEKRKNKKQKEKTARPGPSSPKCKHGTKGRKTLDSDSDLSDRH